MQASSIFLDWIDLKQDHQKTHLYRQTGSNFEPFDLHHSGVYAKGQEIVEQVEDGNVYYLLTGKNDDKKNAGFGFKRGFHEGSHSTKIMLTSDGRIVHCSGNVGRLNRPNNLFNYGLSDTITLANAAISAQGKNIPPFTAGQMFLRETISETDHRKGVSPWFWSGAVCNEIHITQNWYAGSEAIAKDIMRHMSGQRLARVSKSAYGDETINFGMPTRKGQRLHKAVVCYRKAAEMLAHAKGEEAKAAIKASDEYQLANDLGIVRIELKLGSHYLRENNQRYLGDLEMGKLIALYQRETAPLLLANAGNEIRLIDGMPNKLKMSALSWIRGDDVKSLLPLRTFQRHRKELMSYGLDISEPRRVDGKPNAEESLQRMLDALPQHSLKPLDAPEWYGLPEVERKAA